MSYAEQLIASRPSQYRAKAPMIAKLNDDVVGVAKVVLPLGDNEHVAYVHILIQPEHRRRGIGRQLYESVESHLRELGRVTVMGTTEHRADQIGPGAANITAVTGVGEVPSSSASVGFARSLGHSLEQVERFSILNLDHRADADAMLERARAVAGHEYDLVYWEDRCPESLVNNYACLRQWMSVDVPAGSLEIQEEVWDTARVRHAEEEAVKREIRSLVAAARHRSTGQLVGHTILEYAGQKPEVLYQEDTLVLTAFRGHRLGMALKAANILRIQAQWPLARRIYTWNAAENVHMLRINETLGFVPAGCTGMWQKAGFGAQGAVE
ncbi:hypothetical protein GCM10009611_15880 [Arthrobacter roseus]